MPSTSKLYYDNHNTAWIGIDAQRVLRAGKDNGLFLFSEGSMALIPADDPLLDRLYPDKNERERWVFSLPIETSWPRDAKRLKSNVCLHSFTEVSLRQKRTLSAPSLERVQDIIPLLNEQFDAEELVQEHTWMIGLNAQNQITAIMESSRGGVSSVQLDTKVVGAFLCQSMSCKLIVVHNHPSGNANPSSQDNHFTGTIRQICKLFDIHFEDHLILGFREHFSYRNSCPSYLDWKIS